MSICNNVMLTDMVYNGQKVKEWHHNDVLVYRSAVAYRVVFTDYPITITSSRGSVKTAETLSSGYKLNAKKDGNSGSNGQVKASVSLPTQGCNKVDISYRCTNATAASVNGATIVSTFTPDVSDKITLGCSGDTLELNLELNENTAYYTAGLLITEIYFYND